MFNTLSKVFKDALTEDDNSTYCWARLASTLSLLNYLSFAGWGMFHVSEITFVQLFTSFGQNLALVLGGCGALIGLKSATQKPTVINN